MTTVPGVDPGFAFIPRMVSTRIVSTSVTQIGPDGSVEIELANAPEGGRGLLADPHRAERAARLGRGGRERAAQPPQ